MTLRIQVLFSISPLLLFGQSVRIVPDLAVSEAEYHDAEETWLRNDPDLERDLYKADRQEIVRRIHRAAALRDDVMKKKETYLGFLEKRVEDMEKRLSHARGPEFPLGDLKKDLEGEQAHILSEQDRLEGRIHDLPEGDEYILVRRAMESERGDLVALQNAVAQRIHAIDDSAKAQDAAAGLSDVDPLIRKLEDIRKIWEGERARAVAARPAWDRYYADLEKSLTDKNGTVPALSTPPVRTPPAPLAPTHGADQGDKPRAGIPASTPPSTPSGSWIGSWTYKSQQGAWTGWGEPEMVLLQLRQAGSHLEGTYTARLPGRNDKRLLNLALEGEMETKERARLRWTSLEPAAHGVIVIRMSPDGRLLVERLSSDDNYIPQGMEVLQR